MMVQPPQTHNHGKYANNENERNKLTYYLLDTPSTEYVRQALLFPI